MKFACEQCGANYAIADEKIGNRGAKVKCKKCNNLIVLAPISAIDPTVVDQQPMEETVANETSPEGAAGTPENRSDLSGAFDALVTRPQQVDAAQNDEQRIWYVALADGQSGPLTYEEVESHVLQGALTGESLAWKAGMSDWLALATIAELKALSKAEPRRAASKPQVSAAVVAKNAAAAKSVDAWKPTAARDLSELVKDEILNKGSKADESKAKSGFADLGLPDLGSSQDVFAGGGLGNNASDLGSNNWSTPEPRRRKSQDSNTMMLAVVGLVAVCAIGAAIYFGLRQNQPASVAAVAPTNPTPVAATTQAAPAPAQQAAPAAAPSEPAKEVNKASPDAAEEDESTQKKSKLKAAKKEPREPKEAKKAAPMEAAPPAKAALSKEDIMTTVRENARKIMPCLQAARSKGEIPPNTYTFTLGWTIKTNGSVANASLTGPPQVLSTSLPGCFANVLSQWQFPSSGNELPIRNFPLGPIKVP